MDYKELKIVKYNNNDDNKQEYQKRFSTIGVIKTEMYPSLMKRDLPKERDYPLFVVPLLEVQLLSQQIQENSNTIKELANALPAIAKEQFYKEQLYKSIIDTNEIEGVKTTRKEVSEAFKALSQKGKNHKIRLLSTVRMYHDIITQEDLRIDSINIIREIYDNLTDGEIEGDNALDGYLFRDGYINILDENTGKLEHLPPTEEKTILIMLSSWISFINDRTVPFLIKASLSHFFFENVHPFYDGNGRTGRYILSRYLSRKLDIFSGLVISQKIKENKKKYYKAFKTTGDYDNKAEGTFFVITILQMLKEGQDDIISILEDKKSLLDNFSTKLDNLKERSELQKRILYLVFQSTVFVDNSKDGIRDNDIIAILSAHYPKKTIKDTIKQLRQEEVIEQKTKAPSRHILKIEKVFND